MVAIGDLPGVGIFCFQESLIEASKKLEIISRIEQSL